MFDLACDESYHGRNQRDIESEAVEIMLGGPEAIAHVLLHCTIMLISHPEHLRRLRHELATHGVDPFHCLSPWRLAKGPLSGNEQ